MSILAKIPMNPNQFESFVGGDQIKANQLVHKRIKNANVRRTKKTYKKKEEKKKGRRREGSILLHDSDLQEANEVRETFKIIYN